MTCLNRARPEKTQPEALSPVMGGGRTGSVIAFQVWRGVGMVGRFVRRGRLVEEVLRLRSG